MRRRQHAVVVAATLTLGAAAAVATVAGNGSADAATSDVTSVNIASYGQTNISGGQTGFGASMVLGFPFSPQDHDVVVTFTVPAHISMVSAGNVNRSQWKKGTIQLATGSADPCVSLGDNKYECVGKNVANFSSGISDPVVGGNGAHGMFQFRGDPTPGAGNIVITAEVTAIDHFSLGRAAATSSRITYNF